MDNYRNDPLFILKTKNKELFPIKNQMEFIEEWIKSSKKQ